MRDELLIFVHIPKTAGSTLGYPLHRQYRHEELFLVDGNKPEESIAALAALDEKGRNAIGCLSGHIPFGLHRHFPGRKVSYVAVLRDPVRRAVSHYYHILGAPSHYLYEAVVGGKMSLADFAESDLSTEIVNDQTRRISGCGEANQREDRSTVDEATYEQALRNIEEFFPVVGLTERFDESLLLMKERFGWHDIRYARRKVNKARPPVSEVDDAVRATILERNAYDVKLHEFASARLEKQVAEAGASLQAAREDLNRANERFARKEAMKQWPPIHALLKVRRMVRGWVGHGTSTQNA